MLKTKKPINSKKNKTTKIFFILSCIVLLCLPLLLLLTIGSSISLSNFSNTKANSYSTNATNAIKEEKHDIWPEVPPEVESYEFKSLVEQGIPEISNLNELFAWAKKFNVDPNTSLPSTAFMTGSDPKQGGSTVFDWSAVGYATTTQFKNFLTFYGRHFKDEQGNEHTGLENFTSIIFSSTDIEFGLPEFWLSLNWYMPNLKTIKIKGEANHKSLKNLPKEIGVNEFELIEIYNEDVGVNYENFLYKDSPLSKKLKRLILQSSQIADKTTKEKEEDQIYYFTNVIFENATNLTELKFLDLSNNKLSQVRGNLLCLPSIIELRLQYNNISDWYCIDSVGNEITYDPTDVKKEHPKRISGLSQRCFPNPNGITYVDISGNSLTQLVRLQNTDWTQTRLEAYIQQQKTFYRSLNFINMSNQQVEKDIFIFGNNVSLGGTTYSDMNLDLTNVYVLDSNLSENDKVEYISSCLVDRKSALESSTPEDPGKWNNLSKTENVIPSMVNLFSWCSNYINYTSDKVFSDYQIDKGSKTSTSITTSDDNKDVNFYLKSDKTKIDEQTGASRLPESARFFSTDTSSVYRMSDNSQGANALRAAYKSEQPGDYINFPSGVSVDYNNVVHTIDITPYFDIKLGLLTGIASSTYHYNVQIFNDESYVFYLTGIYDPKTSEPLINKYIESISDKQISVDEAYAHFDDLVSYVGQKNKYEYFKSKFNDRDFFKINFVANNTDTRIMTMSLTYYCYEYIGSTDASSRQQTFLIHIKMSPYHDKRLQQLLTAIWIVELCLLVLLLIPLIYFVVRTNKKAKLIEEEKSKIIKQSKKENKPKIDITNTPQKEKKLTAKERFENLVSNGDGSKTKMVDIKPEEIKPENKAVKAVDIDDILADLEK